MDPRTNLCAISENYAAPAPPDKRFRRGGGGVGSGCISPAPNSKSIRRRHAERMAALPILMLVSRRANQWSDRG
jgi:hypothetical protein